MGKQTYGEQANEILAQAVKQGWITRYEKGRYCSLALAYWNEHNVFINGCAIANADRFPYNRGNVFFYRRDGSIGAWLGTCKEMVVQYTGEDFWL